jgi:hypothetical protein
LEELKKIYTELKKVGKKWIKKNKT